MADTEAEDRTQAPSNPRRQQARERGQVAHSPELSGAAGLLAATVALTIWGDGLATGLLAAVGAPLTGEIAVSIDAAGVVSRIQSLAIGLAWPLLLVLATFALGALGAHQAQTQMLWAPALIAPDPSRLWANGQGGDGGFGARAGRGLWALAKTAVIAGVAAWVVRADWLAFHALDIGTADLARLAGQSLRHLLLTLSAATLALGLADYALRYRRFEALLSLTPEEHREDLRSMEGDPSLRSQRRRLARIWRNDPAELLAGASLVLTGPSGLTIVLVGGPPPRPVSIRSIVAGPSGEPLRRAAATARIPVVSAPELCRRLSLRRPPGLPPAPEHLAELASLWPVRT